MTVSTMYDTSMDVKIFTFDLAGKCAYLPCTLIWTEKSLDIFFILLPTYLLRKFGQIWKKVGKAYRLFENWGGGFKPNVKYVKYLLTHL